MTDIFISYSHKDFEYAHQLADEFKRRNLEVWIDDRIDYGDQWPRTIQQNLAACQVFIVIMTQNAFDSMWVQNEVSYAQSSHKIIFPLLLEGEVWLSMAAMQYVDVRARQIPPDSFFEKVRGSLGRPAGSQAGKRSLTVEPIKGGPAHRNRKRVTGLFIAGLLLVFAIAASIRYILGGGTATPPPLTEPPVPAPLPIDRTPYGGGLGLISFISERDANPEGYLMNSDGSAQRNVTHSPTIEDGLSLSPDGTKIAYQSDRAGNVDVYVANADGSNPVRLTDHPAIDGSPHWSPDGGRLLFTSERDGNWEIYIMNVDGSGLIRLTEHPAEDFATDWSSDGQWIAFFSFRTGNWEIYVMRVDGREVSRLTFDPAADGAPSFSPDGKSVVFHSQRDGNWEIYLVNTDGSGLTRLTNDPANDEFPSWSPNGHLIAFESDRDGDYEIYIMRLDNSALMKLTDNADRDRNPIW